MAEKRALDFLLATQDRDGGWAYTIGQPACVEPTAAAVLALRTEPALKTAAERGLAWLRAAQHRDGGWGLNAADPESAWQTAWGILALRTSSRDEAASACARAWLLAVETLTSETDEMQAEWERLLSINSRLRGWPWRPGEASWIEPTALALLALAGETASAQAAARIGEATHYLTDRRCTDGGWNFGNPFMLGAALPPRAHPTALAILALSRVAPDAIEPADLAALGREMAADRGALALAWGLLALRAVGEDDAAAAATLAALQGADGGWNDNPYHTAMAMLAGRGGW